MDQCWAYHETPEPKRCGAAQHHVPIVKTKLGWWWRGNWQRALCLCAFLLRLLYYCMILFHDIAVCHRITRLTRLYYCPTMWLLYFVCCVTMLLLSHCFTIFVYHYRAVLLYCYNFYYNYNYYVYIYMCVCINIYIYIYVLLCIYILYMYI